MTLRHGLLRHAFLLLFFSLGLGLAGCEGDDGAPGADGANGADGADGAAGINCWDLNANGVADLPDEDINGDGVVDVFDCNAFASGAYEVEQLHTGWFTEKAYVGTQSCLDCHGKVADDFITTGHFKWEGVATNMEGFEAGIHGKNDILNNFCIAVPSNEGRCTNCHAGYGYSSQAFDFGDIENVDCLVCHDQTTTYAKAKTTAGLPEPAVDLQAVARSVAMNGGVPTIDNCIDCHAKAGGGDNVKHGDLSMSLVNTTREFDVHMGTDGADFECVACHQVKRDVDGNMLSHGIGGMPYHSVDEGEMKQCDDCHSGLLSEHAGSSVEGILTTVTAHQRLACQSCHIPTFARNTSTKTEWYWEDAGQDIDPIPVDDTVNPPRALYDKKKGSFVWANNVRPTLRWFNGKYDKALINVNDTFVSQPANLAEPQGDHTDPEAMIYPFKRMIGNQPYDTDDNQILVPHLFGMAGGPNPFWVAYDWDLALRDADAITGQGYSGNFGFADTEMYLSVNHEIAPKEQALGYNGDCGDCHFSGEIDWQLLGWTDDPVNGGTRP